MCICANFETEESLHCCSQKARRILAPENGHLDFTRRLSSLHQFAGYKPSRRGPENASRPVTVFCTDLTIFSQRLRYDSSLGAAMPSNVAMCGRTDWPNNASSIFAGESGLRRALGLCAGICWGRGFLHNSFGTRCTVGSGEGGGLGGGLGLPHGLGRCAILAFNSTPSLNARPDAERVLLLMQSGEVNPSFDELWPVGSEFLRKSVCSSDRITARTS